MNLSTQVALHSQALLAFTITGYGPLICPWGGCWNRSLYSICPLAFLLSPVEMTSFPQGKDCSCTADKSVWYRSAHYNEGVSGKANVHQKSNEFLIFWDNNLGGLGRMRRRKGLNLVSGVVEGNM